MASLRRTPLPLTTPGGAGCSRAPPARGCVRPTAAAAAAQRGAASVAHRGWAAPLGLCCATACAPCCRRHLRGSGGRSIKPSPATKVTPHWSQMLHMAALGAARPAAPAACRGWRKVRGIHRKQATRRRGRNAGRRPPCSRSCQLCTLWVCCSIPPSLPPSLPTQSGGWSCAAPPRGRRSPMYGPAAPPDNKLPIP